MVAKAFLALYVFLALLSTTGSLHAAQTTRLDGEWKIATDPGNIGKAHRWFSTGPRPDAVDCKVPGVIQETFPGYHGVAWYWKSLDVPQTAGQERLLLKFDAVDYLAEVWLNGQYVGSHEGGETPFTFDVTRQSKEGSENSLVIRVLNPGAERVDGITLDETPHGIKMAHMRVGGFWNPGGIWQSVQLVRVPAVRIQNVFVDAERKTKTIHAKIEVENDTHRDAKGRLSLDLTPSGGGSTLAESSHIVNIPAGRRTIDLVLRLDRVHSWSPNDPYLYSLTSRLDSGQSTDVHLTRTGFRDLVFRDGYFRLNGQRIFLRSTHSVGHFPIGQHVPTDPELLRRELIYVKAMGFNTVRWLGRTMFPSQLELCDELGLMVYEESYASWNLKDSPDMKRRFDLSIREMILRDRNHPSVVMWGLLNETHANPTFWHATQVLPLVRSIDPTRLVMLSSGRWDGQWSIGSISNPGTTKWQHELGSEAPGAPPAKKLRSTGYTPGSGDIHWYPVRPWTDNDLQFVRTVGTGTKNVFLSEYGNGSQIDPIRIIDLMQQNGANHDLEDYKLYSNMANQLQHDWTDWKLSKIFTSPSQMFTASQRLQSEQRRLALNAIRSNPHIVGYNLTGLSDQAVEGEGLMTTFRELKPGIMDAMIDGFAPLKWCLFAAPTHVYRGATVHLEAVLANEDVLKPGVYPIRLKVVGPAGVLFEKVSSLKIPDPHATPEPPMVFPAFDEKVALNGPSGIYEVEVSFEHGAAAAPGREDIIVGDAATLPTVSTNVTMLGANGAASALLSTHGIKPLPFDRAGNSAKQIILVTNGESASDDWLDRVSSGSIAILLDPTRMPARLKGRIEDSGPRYWGRDDIVKPHPIFNNLPSRCLMDLYFYRDLIAASSIIDFDKNADNIVPTFAVGKPGGQGYWAGSNLLIYNFGSGKVIVSTLRILPNLGKNPAADRILLNMVAFASKRLSEPGFAAASNSAPAESKRFESTPSSDELEPAGGVCQATPIR